MRITVNDLERKVHGGLTVTQLLEAEGEPIGHVLVEINGAHILAQEYDSRVLEDADRVEIILPAAGG